MKYGLSWARRAVATSAAATLLMRLSLNMPARAYCKRRRKARPKRWDRARLAARRSSRRSVANRAALLEEGALALARRFAVIEIPRQIAQTALELRDTHRRRHEI